MPQYVVAKNSDHAPRHVNFSPLNSSSISWFIDTTRLVDHLRRSLGNGQSPWDKESVPSSEQGPSPTLVKHLLKVWSLQPKRQFTRTNRKIQIEIIVGIAGIHELLSQREGPSGEDSDLLTCSGAVAEWDPQAHLDGQSRKRTYLCRTFNESAGGICIDWRDCDLPRIRVGELIAVRYSPETTQFSLGVVRWLRESSKTCLRAGIELIAPNAEAVSCRPAKSESAADSQCLLLPELEGAGIPPSFVTPPYPFRVGDQVALRNADFVLNLTRLLRSSAAFSQFQYSVHTAGADAPSRGRTKADVTSPEPEHGRRGQKE